MSSQPAPQQKAETQAWEASAPISAGLARGWVGAEIAADVAGGEMDGAQAGDLDVGEVLADASALLEDLFGGGADVGGLRVEAKVACGCGR